ncbi:MAG TPA: radical SAM protein [bacterium]|nr:radical SAM protein [bacterium]
MKKILFLTSAAPERAAFNTEEKRPPLGIASLISILKDMGYRVFFSDEYIARTDILDTDFVEKEQLDFVGIYSNTVCYRSTLEMFEKLNRKREKGIWKGKIIVGGPHTSVGIKTIPEYVDHIFIGEGEISLPKLLMGEINDRIVYGEKVEDMDSLPFPAWEEMIHRKYDWTAPFNIPDMYPCYIMNTSRGCPFNCTFCSVKSIWGKSYRYMSAERVLSDLEKLIKNYGARSIFFREDHFTLNKNRVIAFCNMLLEKNIKIKWMCETRVDNLDDYDYVKLMADAGCVMFYIGVESGSPRMLEYFKKGETVEQFELAFRNARKAGIKTYASFVVEAPTETDEDRALTEEFIKKIDPDYVGRNIYVGLPGSEIYDYIVENKLYEHMDEFGIVYPYGFLENVDKYYEGKDLYKVYERKSLVNKVKKWKKILKNFMMKGIRKD